RFLRRRGVPQFLSSRLAKVEKTYAAFTVLVIEEWLLDHPDETMRRMLLELFELRYDCTTTVFCTQNAKKDWHQRLGSGVHSDAIMYRIVYNTIWADSGTHNMGSTPA